VAMNERHSNGTSAGYHADQSAHKYSRKVKHKCKPSW